MTRGFIRKDVYDALVPVDAKVMGLAEKVKQARDAFKGYSDLVAPLTDAYLFSNQVERLGLYYKDCGTTSFGQEILCRQILALPVGSPVETFVPFARLAFLVRKARGSLRRGIRPTVAYVGSQEATEDWAEQAKFHQLCAKIARQALKDFRARHED